MVSPSRRIGSVPGWRDRPAQAWRAALEASRAPLGRRETARGAWTRAALAAVDRAHREEILPYLDRIRAEYALPAIYVTHTWPEVSDRADHVLDLRNGRLEFSGPATGRQG